MRQFNPARIELIGICVENRPGPLLPKISNLFATRTPIDPQATSLQVIHVFSLLNGLNFKLNFSGGYLSRIWDFIFSPLKYQSHENILKPYHFLYPPPF